MRFILFTCLLLITSCLPKQNKVVSAPQAMDVAVAAAVSFPDRKDVTGIPQELAQMMRHELEKRNLQAEILDESTFTDAFASKRRSLHRASFLSENHGGTDLLLMVEAEPRFFSLLTGRYRWTVDATISLWPPEALDETVSTVVSFPIFMEFHHEKEAEVLEAASPVLQRHLGHLLDEYLSGVVAEQ
ncbi:MAG: hypothetical protein HN348_14020 [Proteobacteria bacterium]|jgi:hypothetical protein|nr:hypothetical protein [Pseudomonadota bacterium]